LRNAQSSRSNCLRAIGIVISALADISGGKKKKDQAFVPYRDSTLTWLLKVGADCSEPLPYTLVSSPCWLGQLGRQQQDGDGGHSQPCLRQLRRVAQHVAVTRARHPSQYSACVTGALQVCGSGQAHCKPCHCQRGPFGQDHPSAQRGGGAAPRPAGR